MRNDVDPVITGTAENYTITHPAYGLVRVTHPSGGNLKMFGSDLVHNERVCLTFCLAEEDRNLNSSWYHERGRILEVELTHAQWASLVSSSMGSPTPVTFKYFRDGDLTVLPGIGKQDTAKNKAKREYDRKLAETLERGEKVLAQIEELILKGKAGKKDLDELRSLMQQSLGRFRSDTTFAVGCFEESMESLVSNARIEVESTLSTMAKRLGAEHLGLKLDTRALENNA